MGPASSAGSSAGLSQCSTCKHSHQHSSFLNGSSTCKMCQQGTRSSLHAPSSTSNSQSSNPSPVDSPAARPRPAPQCVAKTSVKAPYKLHDSRTVLQRKLKGVLTGYTAPFVHYVGTTCHKAPRQAAGGWLGVWQQRTGTSRPPLCAFVGCLGRDGQRKQATLGAHVMKGSSRASTASLYIVPACGACNRQHGRECRLYDRTPLVKVINCNGINAGSKEVLAGSIDKSKAEELFPTKKWVEKPTPIAQLPVLVA